LLSKKEAYIFLSAMLRARETKLLNADRASRMLEAGSFSETAKMLTEHGYADMSGMTAREVNEALNSRREEIFSEIARLVPDRVITDILRMKYDYHNAKVIIKSEAMALDPDRLLSETGRICPKALKEQYAEEQYSLLPGTLGKAMEEAKSVLARTSNPQLADFVLDRYYFEELWENADRSGDAFLKGYVRLLTDAANLKSTVRTLRMGKPAEFLKEVLLPNGNIPADKIASGADPETLPAMYMNSPLEKAAALGCAALEGGRLTEFERECDNAVNAYLKKAKMVSFGSEPVVAYLSAVETEITAVRMILTGKMSGIKSEVLRERLRDMYA